MSTIQSLSEKYQGGLNEKEKRELKEEVKDEVRKIQRKNSSISMSGVSLLKPRSVAATPAASSDFKFPIVQKQQAEAPV